MYLRTVLQAVPHRVCVGFRGLVVQDLGFSLGTALAQYLLDNKYMMAIYRLQHFPYSRVLFGGGVPNNNPKPYTLNPKL